jgi:4-carboxymuconolactone decarboxylase
MRIKDLSREEMTEEQRRVADEASSGKRGRMPGPLRIWLHSPEMGARAQRLGEFLRYGTCLGPQLSELAILVTGRFWTSHYEWLIHKREALKAGLSPAVIEAIAARKAPTFEDAKAQAVYDFTVALHETHQVPQAVYAAAEQAIGDRGVVELVGLAGYYTLVSMTLNAFEFALPAGETTELKP